MVVPNFATKVEFLELVLKSLLNIGTGFGVAGKIRTKKALPKKVKNMKSRFTKGKNRITKGKNRITKGKSITKGKNRFKEDEYKDGKTVQIGRFSITIKSRKNKKGRFSIRTKKLK